MKASHIYIKYEGNLDDLALRLLAIISVDTQANESLLSASKREGINRGGLYYLFELLGVELCVITNEGEVFEPDYKEFNFYISVEKRNTIGDEHFNGFVNYLASFLLAKGIQNKVEEIV